MAPANRAPASALMAAIALASYNNLAVTAALPDIGDDLGRVALLPWVITVELLSGAVAVLAVGPFIDGAGARRAFRLTIVATALSSGLCAAAPSMELLVAARLLQGVGTGALIGVSITCIGLVFDDALRPKVYALISSVWGLMGIGSPAIAAVLVGTLGWRSVFAVNLPVAAAAGAVGWSRLPAAAARRLAEPLDRRGLLLMTGLSSALLLGMSGTQLWDLPPLGLGGVLSLALLGFAGLLALAYSRHARGHPWPVLRPDQLIGRRWWPLHATASLNVAGGVGASSFLPLYLRGARGASVAAAAFSVVWPTLGWATSAWASSKLQEHFRAQAVALSGTVILAAGGLAVTLAAHYQTSEALLFSAYFLLGWGIGTVATSCLSLLQQRAGGHEMGRVSSANQFLRSLGFTYGPAVAGLVIFAVVELKTGDFEVVRSLLDDAGALDPGTIEALASGFTWSLAAMTAFCALAVAPALVLAYGYNPDRSTRD